MDNKPLHYDGSITKNEGTENGVQTDERFILTSEARKNLGGNPYEVSGEE
ncbi:hypothetical protein [Bacillus sp. SG-1]|nr:hypothetical protein [Bacillus sp. SG-1]EDL64261.1 azoreductase [Bacillus sp. SG-1]